MGRSTLIALLQVLAGVGGVIAAGGATALITNTRLPDLAAWSIFGAGVAMALATITWLGVLAYRGRREPIPAPKIDADGPLIPPIEIRVVQPPHEASVTYWTGRPASLGDGFVGRDEHRTAIGEAFETHRAVVISGGAGSGKTRLAAEYTHRAGYPGFWTSAGADIVQTLGALAHHLDVPTEGRPDADIAAHAQSRMASLSDQTLWAVDNVDDLDLVNALMSAAGPVLLLITTRDSRGHLLPSTVVFYRVDVLESDPAIELLRSRAGERIESGDPALREIAEAVGYLPLALEMLAVRLAQPLPSPQSVLGELRAASTPIELAAFEEASGAAIPRSDGVFATISGTLSRLPPDVREQLSGLAYIADRPVPLALFEALGGIDAEDAMDRLLSECGRESVLELVDGRIVAHALTRAAIAATNAEGAFSAILGRANDRLNSISAVGRPPLREELPHHESLLTEVRRRLGAEDLSALTYAGNLTIGYQSAGRAQEAIKLDEEVLEARIRLLGPEHPDTLGSKSNLAAGYWAAGRTEEAIRLSEEVLETEIRVLGSDHPDALVSKSNLAAGYQAAGRNEEAIRLNEEVLEVRVRVLGTEHPDTLNSKNNMAECYRAAGRTEEANRLNKEVLEASVSVLGTEHPDTLTTRSNLAIGYQDAGRTEEAIMLNEEVLEVRVRVLGTEHPDTLKSKSNLSTNYQGAGRNEEALTLNEEVLEARIRVLGPEHRDTLRSKSNLAVGYHDAGRTEEAVEMHEEVLAARVRVLGPEHPNTLRSRSNLAASYRAAGRREDADRLMDDVEQNGNDQRGS